jgi:hypothetical protein
VPTPKRPFRGHRLGLCWQARKYLLGARVVHVSDTEIRNLGLVRWRFLIARIYDDEDWERYLRALRAEWAPAIAAKREVWRQRKALARERAKEARKRARERRREVADTLPP